MKPEQDKGVRTCIGCRKTFPRDSLARFVTCDGVLVYDASKNMPGRGAYVCSPACFMKAIQKRSFNGALRVSLSSEAYSRALNAAQTNAAQTIEF